MNAPISHRPNTIAQGGKRVWIYPQEISGKYTRLRTAIAIPLLIAFYVLPWCTWHGYPLLRLSLAAHTFYFLGSPLLIYEFYHFVLLFLLAILTLFLVSALWGRLWCGYACPQTIFIEQVLRRIERWIEGPALRQRSADEKKATGSRFARKILKQVAFLAVALSFGLTAAMYFVDPLKLMQSNAALLGAAVLTGMAWFDGAYWREQFCHLICPYARFQSLMQSKATKTIGYDESRGEPRRKSKSREGAGDCIDCGLCVRVCPAGIDIRQGINQLECVACARCVDGCDSIMASMGKPPGLIRYDSEVGFSGDKTQAGFGHQLKRPRVVVLLLLCLGLFAGGLWGFFNRAPYHVQILTVPGINFVNDGDRVKNIYTIKVGNQSVESAMFSVALKGNEDVRIESPVDLGTLKPGEEKAFPLLFSIARFTNLTEVTIVLKAHNEVVFEIARPLLLPGRGEL